jgi:hypothetical protein
MQAGPGSDDCSGKAQLVGFVRNAYDAAAMSLAVPTIPVVEVDPTFFKFLENFNTR